MNNNARDMNTTQNLIIIEFGQFRTIRKSSSNLNSFVQPPTIYIGEGEERNTEFSRAKCSSIVTEETLLQTNQNFMHIGFPLKVVVFLFLSCSDFPFSKAITIDYRATHRERKLIIFYKTRRKRIFLPSGFLVLLYDREWIFTSSKPDTAKHKPNT